MTDDEAFILAGKWLAYSTVRGRMIELEAGFNLRWQGKARNDEERAAMWKQACIDRGLIVIPEFTDAEVDAAMRHIGVLAHRD